MLKNRATNKVLFVVLFTLYLKEDIDEDGNVKEGVEGGKPIYLLGDKERERHERLKNGDDIEGDAEEAEGKEEHAEQKTAGGFYEDDDVD